MEIKAADISGLEKNRMDAAASQSFIAVAVNIGEGISSADMYIEHYQKGKLVERIGPVSADYSEGKSDTLQFVYFESIKMRYCMSGIASLETGGFQPSVLQIGMLAFFYCA